MEASRLRVPALRPIRVAASYLQANGGQEVMPCLWVHPDHPECMVIAPDGQLLREFSRPRALLIRSHAWHGWYVPSVSFTAEDWPLLQERWPERPSVIAGQ